MARRNLSEAIASRNDNELSFVFGTSRNEKSLEKADESQECVVPRDLIICSFTFVPDGKAIRYYYDPDELDQWAVNDIKPNGIRSPLWVRPHPHHPDHYELVAGFRRFKAAEIINLTTIPIKVFDWDDEAAFQAAFAENSNRRDFSALEELDNMLRLLEIYIGCERDEAISLLYRMNNASKGNTNQNVLVSREAEIAETVFKTFSRISWQSFVAARLSLLKKPKDILDSIRQGKIHYTKAIPIAGLKDPKQRQQLLAEAIQSQLSLAEIKHRVKLASDTTSLIAEPSFKQRLTTTLQRVKQNQTLWGDPKQKQKLEKILSQLEAVLATSEATNQRLR